MSLVIQLIFRMRIAQLALFGPTGALEVAVQVRDSSLRHTDGLLSKLDTLQWKQLVRRGKRPLPNQSVNAHAARVHYHIIDQNEQK